MVPTNTRSHSVKTVHLSTMLAAVAVFSVMGCEGTTSSIPKLLTDATVTADVATSSGDALASAVQTMTANETQASLPYVVSNSVTPALDEVRSRTCYDANGAVVANCSPL